MTVEIIIQEVRKQVKMSLEELSDLTGINKKRLKEIEEEKNLDNILFIEMLMIAQNLGKNINELYKTQIVEIK